MFRKRFFCHMIGVESLRNFAPSQKVKSNAITNLLHQMHVTLCDINYANLM